MDRHFVKFGLAAIMVLLIGAVFLSGCTASNTPQQNGTVKNTEIPPAPPQENKTQPTLAKDQYRALITVDYPDHAKDLLVLGAGESKSLRDGTTVLVDSVGKEGDFWTGSLRIDGRSYKLIAGQTGFAGISGSKFDVLAKPSEAAAKLQVLGTGGSIARTYDNVVLGGNINLAETTYTITDIDYGMASNSRFLELYYDGQRVLMDGNGGIFGSGDVNVKIIDIHLLSNSSQTGSQPLPPVPKTILPSPPSTVGTERGYFTVKYADGDVQIVVLQQNGAANLKNGQALIVNTLNVDYTLASNKAVISIGGRSATLKPGQTESFAGFDVQMDDIILTGNFKAKLEAQNKKGTVLRTMNLNRGEGFTFDGKSCKLADIYPGISMNVKAVEISCPSGYQLLSIGESVNGTTENLRFSDLTKTS